MTFDGNKISEEVGNAWSRSPLSFVFGAVMFVAIGGALWSTLQIFSFATELTADADRRATETRAEIIKQGEQTFQLLDEFRERQKIFRDNIWEVQQERELKQQELTAQFFAGFNEQFKILNTRMDQVLSLLAEIERREQTNADP